MSDGKSEGSFGMHWCALSRIGRHVLRRIGFTRKVKEIACSKNYWVRILGMESLRFKGIMENVLNWDRSNHIYYVLERIEVGTERESIKWNCGSRQSKIVEAINCKVFI